MRYFLIIIILASIFTGCNSEGYLGMETGSRVVTFHTVDREYLYKIAGATDSNGYASWDAFDCDIYLMPQDEYVSLDQYDCVVNHELRHCAEGHFHKGKSFECSDQNYGG